MNIIALDPGKTTGVVVKEGGTVVTHEQMDFMEVASFFHDYLWAHKDEDVKVVVEAFIITMHTAKNTQAPWSLELIGVFRYLTERITGGSIILQKPSDAKRFASDERLKLMGYYARGKGHANDAARHLLLFEASRGLLDNDTLASFVV